ncbi:MAG: type II secretion system minor pseudopilin GspJ [Sphingomonadaceae bacterium]
MKRPESAAGFTLVEMMVALFIFGMLAASGVALLSFSVRAQAATTERLDRLGALQRLNSMLTADLTQAVPRPVRDQNGATIPAFVGEGGQDGDVAIGLVRGGWSNPASAPRPSLQRVEYRLVEDRLERTRWPMLDGAAPYPASVIMSGVKSLAVRFHDKQGWRDQWDAESPVALPDAVEIVLDMEDVGVVRQLLLTGSEAQP